MAHIVVAERDDQLRDLGSAIDLDVDAIDVRRALAAAIDVFELEGSSYPQELEVRSDQELALGGSANARLHGRSEAVDVEPNAGAGIRFGVGRTRRIGARLAAVDAAHVPEGGSAGPVEVGEANAELTAPRAFAPPDHVGLGSDLLGRRSEAAKERLTDVGEVRGTELHARRGEIHPLSFEGGTGVHLSADFDDCFERDSLGLGIATIFMNAHRFLQPGVEWILTYGRKAMLAKFW